MDGQSRGLAFAIKPAEPPGQVVRFLGHSGRDAAAICHFCHAATLATLEHVSQHTVPGALPSAAADRIRATASILWLTCGRAAGTKSATTQVGSPGQCRWAVPLTTCSPSSASLRAAAVGICSQVAVHRLLQALSVSGLPSVCLRRVPAVLLNTLRATPTLPPCRVPALPLAPHSAAAPAAGPLAAGS